MWIFPTFPVTNDNPPTIYAILNSYVNFNAEERTKIKDLASAGRECIFDFDYPLSENIDKEEFETTILNHYMMRRIGFDTPTAFKINLNAKLHEIMPNYNKLFDALKDWNLLKDGEKITRTKNKSENVNTDTQSSGYNVNDMRYSNMPQGKLENVRDASYITDYNYNQTNNSASGNVKGLTEGEETENITKTPADDIRVYTEFIKYRENVYTMIFKDLDLLFYGLA